MASKTKELLLGVESLSVVSSIECICNFGTNKSISLKGIATETTRVLNNIDTSVSTESEVDIDQLEKIKVSLLSKLHDNYCSVSVDQHLTVTNYTQRLEQLNNTVVELDGKIMRLESSRDLPMLSNIKPSMDYIPLMTEDGIQLDKAVNVSSAWIELIVTPMLRLMKRTTDYVYSELSRDNPKLSSLFSPVLPTYKTLEENTHGLKRLVINIDSSNKNDPYSVLDALKRSVIDLYDIPNVGIRKDILIQSKMPMVDWITFNNKVRSEKDLTIIKPIEKMNCSSVLDDIKIKIEQLSNLSKEFSFLYDSDYNYILDKVSKITYEDLSEKNKYLLELLSTVSILYESTLDKIVSHIFDTIESSLKYVHDSISLYDY